MKRAVVIIVAVLLAAGTAAWLWRARESAAPAGEGASSSSFLEESSSSSAAREEAMQTYVGLVEELGASIYMEGSHRLLLQDGGFLLLRSDIVNLQIYEGQEVAATGSVRDSVEGGALIMSVIEVALLPSSAEQSSEGDGGSSATASAASSSSAVSSSPALSSSAPPPPTPLPALSASSSVSSLSMDSAMLQRVRKMAREKPESAWTLQYCSAHIAVCFPVRGDYYYQSFGATTSSLWHVEINSEEIVNLGDGPLVVNLVAGRLDPSIEDLSVVANGDVVTGYRAWTASRHFEVTAPIELRAAVEFVSTHIIPYEQPEEQAASSSSV